MTRLARTAPTRRHPERGAVATIVAVLLGGGVLLGCSALSIDVGSIMFERRQLQNGADASAIALARACGKSGVAGCGADTGTAAGAVTNSTLTRLNNVNNTKDQLGGFDPAYPAASASSLRGLCASATSWGLPACPASTSAVTDCPPVPTSISSVGAPYVEVHTITKQGGSNPTILPNAISRIIVGGTAGESVKACAPAAWGPPAAGKASLPITISGCDWQHVSGGNAGGGGGSYYTGPVYNGSNAYGYSGTGQPAWPTAAATPPAENLGGEVILMIQNPSSGGTTPTPCPNWQGHALPGGFGLLETVSGNPCKVVDYANNWVHTSAGSSTGCDLSSYVGKIVSIPVFDCTASALPATAAIPPPGGDCTQGNGSNAWYHREGYALFYLSGYGITVTGGPANRVKSLVSNNFPCSSSQSCVSGWFLNGELTATSLAGPPGGTSDFGGFAVVPAG
jgi:hypothetical protein